MFTFVFSFSGIIIDDLQPMLTMKIESTFFSFFYNLVTIKFQRCYSSDFATNKNHMDENYTTLGVMFLL